MRQGRCPSCGLVVQEGQYKCPQCFADLVWDRKGSPTLKPEGEREKAEPEGKGELEGARARSRKTKREGRDGA